MIRDWKQYIKTKEDYEGLYKTGMMYEFFPEIPTWKECEEILKGEKEKNE